MGRYAVTQDQWHTVASDNPSKFKDPFNPVEEVSWHDCKDWLEKAGGGLRLPLEAEWEYACRAGTTTKFCFGDTVTPEQVNFNTRFPRFPEGYYERAPVVAVGSLPGNAFGLFEVHGNVWEWCEDSFGTDKRVFRGGSCFNAAEHCHSGFRGRNGPHSQDSGRGFRVAKDIP